MGFLNLRTVAALLLVAGTAACTGKVDRGETDGGATAPATPRTSTLTVAPEPMRTVPIGEAVRVSPVGKPGSELMLTLDEVDVVDACPGRAEPAQTPQQGYFVILEVTATLSSPDGSAVAPLGAENFALRDSQGLVQAISSTDASWACFEESELLPPFADTGGPVRGKVVLDSRTAEGYVTYRTDESWNWSWRFP